MGKDNNHVRTKTIMCALRALCIVTKVTLWLWRQGLLQPGVTGSWKCPPGWSDPPSRVSCAVSLDPGNGSLDPGGHLCPSPVNSPTNYSRMTSSQPVKKTASKIHYSRLPRIAGSSLNHMIRNCPTTSQEIFNDGYNTQHTAPEP